MIKNNKLLIDKDCPMCKLYGGGFISLALLDNESLLPYQEVPINNETNIDFDRAQNEIALHDTITGTTTYGIDTLIKIVSQKQPWLRALLCQRYIYTLLKRLYKFISYNRKVIVPAAVSLDSIRTCAPSFNRSYRWAYIMFVAITTALIVNAFTQPIFLYFGWSHSLSTELLLCFGQVAWQSVAAYLIIDKDRLTYLGNMSTVSMIGGLLLLPCMLLLSLINSPIYVNLFLFFTVITIMFFEHIRRCKLLDISLWMTASWITFRVAALSILVIILEIL